MTIKNNPFFLANGVWQIANADDYVSFGIARRICMIAGFVKKYLGKAALIL
jgi:hypothetical protein